MPISTTTNEFPLHIPLPKGLKARGVVEVQQETTLDLYARRWRKIYHVSEDFLKEVLDAIEESYELE